MSVYLHVKFSPMCFIYIAYTVKTGGRELRYSPEHSLYICLIFSDVLCVGARAHTVRTGRRGWPCCWAACMLAWPLPTPPVQLSTHWPTP